MGVYHVFLHDTFRGLRIANPDGINDHPVVVRTVLHSQGTDDILHGNFKSATQDIVEIDDSPISENVRDIDILHLITCQELFN